MKIFNEEEIDEAAYEYSKECGDLGFERTDFTAGAEYVESKVEDLCIEFAEFAVDSKWDKVMHQGYNDDGTLKCRTTKQLFEQFLKERK